MVKRTTDNFQSVRILLVTASDEGRQHLHDRLCQFAGVFLVGAASDADGAVKEVQNQKIDLVLIDLASQIDGNEVTKQIRKTDKKVAVLVCTASDSTADIFSAMNAGADGYVLKGSIDKHLEMAVRSLRLGTVWLDPGIARQILELMVAQAGTTLSRTLPTGLMVMPMMPQEKEILSEVASSNCVDGVCMVDPSFLKKLKRFAPA